MLQHSPADPFFCETSTTLYAIDLVRFFISLTASLRGSTPSSGCSKGTVLPWAEMHDAQPGTSPFSAIPEASDKGLLWPGVPTPVTLQVPSHNPFGRAALVKGLPPPAAFPPPRKEAPLQPGEQRHLQQHQLASQKRRWKMRAPLLSGF